MGEPRVLDIRDSDVARAYDLLRPAGNDPSKTRLQYLLSRCFPLRYGYSPRVIVLHVQDGTTRGSLLHWTDGRDANGYPIAASSTVMINRDGTILRVIPERDAPWTNGDVQRPTSQARYLLSLGSNPNLWSLTIEKEGRPGDNPPINSEELESILWLCRHWSDRYGIPLTRDRVLPHSAINSVTRSRCPGPYYETVMSELQSSSELFPGMPLELLSELFGVVVVANRTYRYNPSGPVSQLWTERGRKTGQWPKLVAVRDVHNSLYFTFCDGWTVWRPKGSRNVRVLKEKAG